MEYKHSATRKFRSNCLNEFYDVCAVEKRLEAIFPLCKNAFAYKRFSNILLVSRLYFFHKDNHSSEKQRYGDYLVWCKKDETRAVAKDVLRTMKKNDIRSFVFRAFSLCLLLGLYRLCWMALKIYCKRR